MNPLVVNPIRRMILLRQEIDVKQQEGPSYEDGLGRLIFEPGERQYKVKLTALDIDTMEMWTTHFHALTVEGETEPQRVGWFEVTPGGGETLREHLLRLRDDIDEALGRNDPSV